MAARADTALKSEQMTRPIASPILPATKRRTAARSAVLEIPQHEVESTADAGSIAFIELQNRLEAALREREELIRQRDELSRQLAALNHTVPELSAQLDECRRQLTSVRRARDAAQAHANEISCRLSTAEDRVGDLESQLESVQQERDDACSRAEEFTKERDDLHRAVLDLAEQRATVVREQQMHITALADAQNQLVRISRERDAARATADEEAQAIAELHTRLKTLMDEAAAQADSAAEADALKQTVRNLETEVARLQVRANETAGLAEQVAEAERNRSAAIGAIAAAQRQVEMISRDRDRIRAESAEEKAVLEAQVAALQARIVSLQNTVTLVRTEASEEAVVLEAQVAALHAQLTSIEEATADSPGEHLDAPEVAERIRQQRAELIDLVSHLETAQRKNRELASKLAEVRAPGFAPASASVAPRLELVVFAPVTEPLPNEMLAGELSVMSAAFGEFQANSDRLDLLQRLYVQAMTFAERVRAMNLQAAASLVTAVAECLQWLHRTPNRINADVLDSIAKSFDLLALSAEAGVLDRLKDPAECVVYAVDDDEDNCECISAALSRHFARTKYSLRPSAALTELARGEYDLILLDVNLPEMGGFELCRHIRTLEQHTGTPVIFLSGMGSAETRRDAAESGGDDFIHKPFDLHELSVRALTQVIRGQL